MLEKSPREVWELVDCNKKYWPKSEQEKTKEKHGRKKNGCLSDKIDGKTSTKKKI